MADEAERGTGNSPAVTRAIRILDLLAEARGAPRTLTEIARELGLAKSSVSNLCAALEEGGLVRRITAGYLLGRRTVDFGSAFLAGFNQIREFYRVCEESEVLRHQLVQIALLDGAQVLYLAVYEGRQRFPMSASVGDRYPASVTAVGTALLSELTPTEIAELYWDTSNLVGFTKKSTSTLAELQEKLERTRERGYAVDEGEVHPTVITNATKAGLFVVFARTAAATETSTGIAVFLVPADAPGITVGTKDAKMGQEGSRTAEVTFSDVRVGPEALVGGDGDIGYRAAMTSLARGRIHMAALAVGSAQRALDESVAYAATATQGGTPIGSFQLVQAMIADQQTGVLAGRALAREAARLYVTGEDRRIAPSAAKLFCTEMAGQTADLGVQVHGGSGYMREVAVERIYRDVRLMRLYEGTSEIQRLIIGGGLVRQAQRSAS
jgi:DNA-binding IclR family transcriptional regulator